MKLTRPRSLRSAATLVAVGLLAASSVHGEVLTLIADGFTDGARGNGTDAHDVAWLSTAATGVAVIDDAGFNSGKALDLATGGGVLHATFAPTTLQVGESLSLRFNYRLGADISSFGNSFRFALLDSNGSHPGGDNSSGALNNDLGYFVWTNSGSNSAATTIRRDTNSDGGANSQFTNSSFSTALNASAGAGVDAGTTVRGATFTITRDSLTSLSFSADVVGGAGTSFVATDAMPSTFTFDYVGFRLANTTTPVTSLVLGDVSLTHSAIPEPSAFAALAGLGALGLATTRRRRRQA